MLPKDVPLVKELDRGELFGVFDGIGSAQRGKEAAQAMADILIKFYQHPEDYGCSAEGILRLLREGNEMINGWGQRPLYSAPGTGTRRMILLRF